jgi:peptidoglycan/xylan/chitin deacetylase (PgdA/CDA1 family)
MKTWRFPKKVTVTFWRNAASIMIATVSLSSFAACPDGKTYNVHLTFDDGPSPDFPDGHGGFRPGRTSRILDFLKAEKVPATFFVMGSSIQASSSLANKDHLIKRIRDEGHTLASHTYIHKSHTCDGSHSYAFTPKKARKNLKHAHNNRNEIFNSNLFRFPYGRGWEYEPGCPGARVPIMEYAHKLGMQHLGWDVDSKDYMTNPPFSKQGAEIIPEILEKICETKGGVILFHDINPWTSRYLGKAIRAIKAAGHRLTTLDKISRDRDSFNQAPGGARAEAQGLGGESVVK